MTGQIFSAPGKEPVLVGVQTIGFAVLRPNEHLMKKAPLVIFVSGIAGIVVGLGLIFASLASTGFRSCGSGPERFGGYQVAPSCPHFTNLVLTWVWLVFTLAIPLTLAGGILCPDRARRNPSFDEEMHPPTRPGGGARPSRRPAATRW